MHAPEFQFTDDSTSAAPSVLATLSPPRDENLHQEFGGCDTLIHSDNFAQAWFELLGRLYEEGRPVSPRGYETHELLGVQLRIDNLRKNLLVHPKRNLNYRFAVAEWLWIAAGRGDVATIAGYNKNIAQFSDNGYTFDGAYGPRVVTQMPYLLEQLQKPGSRQAIMTIWSPSPAPSKDIPCTVSWQCLAREGRLHAIVTMRSSDIWLGLPYDIHNFGQLTSGVASELGLELGSLTYLLGSSHLYDRDREKAYAVLNTPATLRCVTSPLLPGLPPANDILDLKSDLPEPWATYREVLTAATSAEALARLESLDE